MTCHLAESVLHDEIMNQEEANPTWKQKVYNKVPLCFVSVHVNNNIYYYNFTTCSFRQHVYTGLQIIFFSWKKYVQLLQVTILVWQDFYSCICKTIVTGVYKVSSGHYVWPESWPLIVVRHCPTCMINYFYLQFLLAWFEVQYLLSHALLRKSACYQYTLFSRHQMFKTWLTLILG